MYFHCFLFLHMSDYCWFIKFSQLERQMQLNAISIISKMCFFYIFNFAPELSSWNAQSRFIRENYLLFTFVKDKQILNIVLILELLILKWQKTRVGNSLFGFSWETLVFLWTKERNSDLLFSKSYSNRSRCSLAIRSWA